MDMRIKTAGGYDHAFAGNGFRARSDNNVHAGLNIWISRFTDSSDTAVINADIGFDDPPMIQDHSIRDDRINSIFDRTLGLAHAIPDDFTAAELHLFPVNREVFFDLDYELGISQTDSIAHRWTEHFCVRLSGDLHGKGVQEFKELQEFRRFIETPATLS